MAASQSGVFVAGALEQSQAANRAFDCPVMVCGTLGGYPGGVEYVVRDVSTWPKSPRSPRVWRQGVRCWSPGPGRCLEGFPPAVWPASGKKSPAEALDAMRKGGPVRARRDAILKGDLPVCPTDANTEAVKAADAGNASQPVPRSRALSFSPMRGRWERAVHPCERQRVERTADRCAAFVPSMVLGRGAPCLLALSAAFCFRIAQAVSTEGKSFFDVDWTDSTAAGMEIAWRGVKITFALSPLIAIVMLFCCTKDDPEEEELRRKKKFDFSLDSGE
eukprot:symbB.v1.2.029677.t1/scaffold3280.1/size59835/4